MHKEYSQIGSCAALMVGRYVWAVKAKTLMLMKPFMVSSGPMQLSFTGINA